MKLTALLLLIACLQVSARGDAQITLSETGAPLKKILQEIEKQSGYLFWYNATILEHSPPVSIHVRNVTLQEALAVCFKGQQLTYTIVEKVVVVKELKTEAKAILPEATLAITISGKVTNEKGEPVSGATISVKGAQTATASSDDGNFTLAGVPENATLVISSIGYEKEEIAIKGKTTLAIRLRVIVNSLDEMVVIAYGSTTKRLNTGSVGKVTAEEIGKQPVSNLLAALEGQVPGLLVTQSKGYSGSSFSVQIRGRNSLDLTLSRSEPLYIIDGVPFAPGNDPINQINSAAQLSPLYTINPADVESIEVLKDADATAIYGSRGANGVILITTKRGKAGKTKVDLSSYTGISRVTRTMDLLNTQQYVQMRREAQFNDGVVPTAANSADIVDWDTTRYTDFKKLLIGGTAHTSDIQLSVSGGNATTQFLIGAGYHRETTVLPTDLADTRASANFTINHASANNKLSLSLKTIYSLSDLNLPTRDLASVLTRPPNIKLYDSLGNLNWEEKGVSFKSISIGTDANPLAILKTKYSGEYQNILTNLQLNYKILGTLTLKANLGYNLVMGDETRLHPSASLDPFDTQLPYSYFANQTKKSWIIEPQADYSRSWGRNKLNILLGATWQDKVNKATTIEASNYINDALLSSISGAGIVTPSNSYTQYRYTALFARINYNWKDKYVFNLSGRRDGSSRFGPDNRFSNFGAIGIAWIFSSERSVQQLLPFLSFGKVRFSYGITGNDQIGDYKFLDTWGTGSTTYQQVPVLTSSGLFNPVLSWESNAKLETSIDLGFLNDRIIGSFTYFRNRSGNQLINYALPIQTGFASITKNFEALIQNKGYEVEIRSKNISTKNLNWNTSFNITVARNKLLEFPGLSTSSYANNYIIGEPLSVVRRYHSLGVDPSTGVYSFVDVDRNGTYNVADRTILKNSDTKFYGGLQNNISYKGFQISFSFEFRKQEGSNYIGNLLLVPGYRFYNQPVVVFNRWQKPGDLSAIQMFTATTTTQAYKNANSLLSLSDATFGDASYIRCRNVSISYSLPSKLTQIVKMSDARIYIQAQNVFTITNYVGGDPENQSVINLPPLRTFTAGFQISF